MSKPIVNGRWLQAEQIPSPNCDERPDPADISLIVIHCISLPPGQYGGNAIERFFCNVLPAGEHAYFEQIAELTVSAHLLIRRDGSPQQFVDFGARAWHAGQSCYAGREACNDFSIGIELEGLDTDTYTDAQYQSLATICAALIAEYPGLDSERIAGHEAIAPGRKTDPGPGFDWPRFRALLEAQQAQGNTA